MPVLNEHGMPAARSVPERFSQGSQVGDRGEVDFGRRQCAPEIAERVALKQVQAAQMHVADFVLGRHSRRQPAQKFGRDGCEDRSHAAQLKPAAVPTADSARTNWGQGGAK